MKIDQTLTCQRCQYDFNPPEAKECVICSYPLKRASISPKSNFYQSNKPINKPQLKSQQRPSGLSTFQFLIPVVLSFFLLTVLLGGGYLFLQRQDQLKLLMSQIDGEPIIDSKIKSYQTMQEVPDVPAGLFNYGGATCFAALTKYGMNETITKAYPEYQLRYTEPLNSKPGCSTGIEMLLNSELSFAQNGRPLQDHEYAKAQSRNFTLKQIPVAIDGIVFFVNPRLPVSGLSINQLKNIFQGKITNWQEVGGPNLPIVAISQDPTVHITINSLLNNGEHLGKNVKIVRDYTTAMRQVAATPGGISDSSAAIARGQKSIRGLGLALGDSQKYVLPFTKNGQVNLEALRNGSYPLTRRLFVVVRQDGTIDEQAGIAYANLLLTAEGQQIVKQAGFVPLH
ncbi:MAG: PstS family phosphate ABC transporter substrate-binding protein [Waterburya sp.]